MVAGPKELAERRGDPKSMGAVATRPRAEVITLWGGPHEHKMRIASGPLPRPARIIRIRFARRRNPRERADGTRKAER